MRMVSGATSLYNILYNYSQHRGEVPVIGESNHDLLKGG